MKATILGGDGNLLCQIPALRQGFAALGHEHIADSLDPDSSFTFVGNPPFGPFLDLCGTKKVIFNVLDICFHCREIDQIISDFSSQLPQAARVTAISKTVAWQLAEICGVRAETIYYPMKAVRYQRDAPDWAPLPYRVLLCGRLGDPNKRARAAISALLRAGYDETEVAVVGGENPGWGSYLGVVSDEVLNQLFNSVDYVMMLSRNEGIGLPAIEGAVCGAIPIVLPDLSTYDEFWSGSPLALNYQTLTSVENISNLIMAIDSDREWKSALSADFAAYGELAFVPKFDRVNVARRIVDIYHTI